MDKKIKDELMAYVEAAQKAMEQNDDTWYKLADNEQPVSKWNLGTHITGKVYDLTQENMNAMISDLEYLRYEITTMRIKLNVAISALVEIDNECGKHDKKAQRVANFALQEIEEIKARRD